MAKLLCSIMELTPLLILLALESMEARLVIMNESLLQEEAREAERRKYAEEEREDKALRRDTARKLSEEEAAQRRLER